MRIPIAWFDPLIIKIIGKIPASWHRGFHLLGYATMPAAWAVLLSLVTLGAVLGGGFEAKYLVVIACIPLASTLKLFIRRQRPPTIYAENMRVKSYSFPSSHAYSGALGGGFLALLALDADLFIVGIFMLTLVIFIGISRIHLGAHYPSDVLAGWTLAVTVLVIIESIL